MIVSVQGSGFPPDFPKGWRRISRQYASGATAGVSIPLSTTSTIASAGVLIKWSPRQACRIVRYACGVSASTAANQILFFAASLELQVGGVAITNGSVSNDTDMLPATPSAAAANAQTLSDMSVALSLRDDFHEFADYQELGGQGIGQGGLGLRCFFRLRNTDGAASHNVETRDNLLYEIWEQSLNVG